MVASVNSSALVSGVKPLDIAGAITKGNTALESEIDTQAKQQAFGDQQMIRELAASNQADFSTPKGIKDFMTKTAGKLSPEASMKLGDMYTKMSTAENQRLMAMSKLGDEERARYEDTTEAMQNAFDGMDKVEDPEDRKAQILTRLTEARSRKTDAGTPLYSDKAIESLINMPWEQQQALYKGSKHFKELLARSKDAAQIERLGSLTQAQKDGKVENWVGENGEALLRHQNGDVFKVDLETGEQSKLAAMPKGAYKAGSKNPNAAKEDELAVLSPEENTWLAEYQGMTGKQVPGIPAGSGAAARKARLAYLKDFVRLGKERGYTGDEAGVAALQRDASKEAIKRLTTTNAVIVAGEKDLENITKTIKEELQKLGGPDSPVVRKYWNKASTDWAGDPQFSGLNAALTNYKETAARVFSGQSGAGGTPVTYLHLAEQAIGNNPTLEQFSKLDETMGKLFKAREESTRSALGMLREGMQLKPKEGSKAATETTGDEKLSVDDARNELKLAREKVRTATDPEQKRLAESAVKDLEVKISKVSTDTSGKRTPSQKDIDYVKAHPEARDRFIKTFGEDALK